MQLALTIVFRVALAVALCSLACLLFMLGHTEETPLIRILGVAALAAFCALVAGLLEWVGLPAIKKQEMGGKHSNKRPSMRGK